MSDFPNLNFPKQYYVGSHGPFDTANPQLAFATIYDYTAAFGERKTNVDTWARTYNQVTKAYEDGHAEVIENDFLEGFSFEKSVSRWSTSNKWFTINDPRGFQLQISADNLADVILNCDIEKGQLKGKFCWAKNKAVIYLCREDHPSYVQTIKPAFERKMAIGDKVDFGNNKDMVFIGERYALFFGHVSTNAPADGSYYRNDENLYNTYSFADPEPFYAYQNAQYIKDNDPDGYFAKHYSLFRGKPKKAVIKSQDHFFFEHDGEFVKTAASTKDGGYHAILFKTKQELLDYQIDPVKMRDESVGDQAKYYVNAKWANHVVRTK